MFLGRYYHTLESKGRLAIPAIFRRQLGKDPIITRGLDGCLFLLPQPTWKKLLSEIKLSPLTTQDTREFVRIIVHDAQLVVFDPQGRTLITKPLKEYADLTKPVVVAGSLDWIEIWDQQKYHKHMKTIETQANLVAERLASRKTNE